jgi:toxin-antitoxin system PIN domain toxin
MAVDTNVLACAHRAESPHHAECLALLRRLAEGMEAWALPVFCVGEFLRVVTHPRVFDPPSRFEQAGAWLARLLESPSLRILHPGDRFVALLLEQARRGDARGNLVFDAQIAAVCLEHGVDRLATRDRDFARFPSLRIIEPT